MTHKQVIVLRKDLNMRKGKMVAQGSHASLGALLSVADKQHADGIVIPMTESIKPWLEGKFTKICVSVDSESALIEIYEKAKASGLLACLIQDYGLTEFNGIPTYTAVGIGPDLKEKIDVVTQHLPLL